MNHLMRELAPLSSAAWSEIEEEARRTIKVTLAGRRLVDFQGPLGWSSSAVGLGRTESLPAEPRKGVSASLRRAQPLVEFKVPFEVSRAELELVDRGAKDVDLEPVTEAALAAALAEDGALFHGFSAGHIAGICEAADNRPLELTDDYARYPAAVAEAIDQLAARGVEGPYAIALGPRCYTGLMKTTIAGYPAIAHVKRLIEGPVTRAQAVDGAVVLSLRGGDFELTVGADFSIGYSGHDATRVHLFLVESFTFRVLGPEAAVPLVYKA